MARTSVAEEVRLYMSAIFTRSERQLDALWRTLSPEAKVEVTARLNWTPPIKRNGE